MAFILTYLFTPLLGLVYGALTGLCVVFTSGFAKPYQSAKDPSEQSSRQNYPTIAKGYQLKAGVITSLLLTIVLQPLILDEGQERDWVNLLGSQILLWLLGVSCWLVNQYWFGQQRIILTWWSVLLSLVMCALLSPVFYLVSTVYFEDYPNLVNSTGGLLRLAYRGILISGLLYPPIIYLHQQQAIHSLRLEVQQSKQQNSVTAIHYLHQQLDSHFLFNSLNVLHAGAQQKWVRNYVWQLSQVYRYFLQNGQGTELVTLSEEINFVRSYIHGLEERFETGLQVIIGMEPETGGWMLPPLSLQVLIENAVKHNVISLKRPLRIDIFTQERELIVRNVLQRRTSNSSVSQESLGIGLKNLAERYRLIVHQAITIQEDSDYFVVRLPLLGTTPE